jgi:beta-aspartyl-peptidase (threonine type)
MIAAPFRASATALLAATLVVAGCAPAPAPVHPGPTPPPASTEPAADAPAADAARASTVPSIEWGLVMHGGAGTITRASMTPEREAEYRAKMEEALRAGHAVLADGGSSLDAVVAAIVILEDSPLFNSGKGAVFTADGTNSLDASIMYGPTLEAGAVAGVGTVRNPIRLARAVMEASPHVLLSGAGAETFAAEQGLEIVDPEYFYTERRWKALERAREAERQKAGGEGESDAFSPLDRDSKFGTVGVIALDPQGRIAAGTSTGGMTNKKWGRIGDSPIIGAGTYADARCGISATGWGEYFIRNVVAYDICARMKYQGLSLEAAARAMIMEQLEAQEPQTGGVVALDGEGHVVMMFNTPGMYRGYIDADGTVETAIYRE